MKRTLNRATLLDTILGIALIALTLLSYSCTTSGERAGQNAASSKDHPGFPLPDLKGKMISPADYRGKIVFVNFWATWCGPCRHEIPDFLQLYQQYHDKGLEILGVAVSMHSTDEVKAFANDVKINYPVLIGNDNVAATYEVEAIPTTLVFDRNGKLHKRLVGAQSRESLEAMIKSLL